MKNNMKICDVTQVLEAARLANPYMDTYYHKRDHSLLLALHNPVGANSDSKSLWSTKLHSNVGFRNYLEHVVTSIGDWVQEQVFIYLGGGKRPLLLLYGKLVLVEKERYDWFPERSEFCSTER